MKALALALMAGCAATPLGVTSPEDTNCGSVGPVSVARRYAMADCGWLRADVAVALRRTPLRGPWAVVFTGGAPGMDMDGVPNGCVYPANRTIFVSTYHRYAIFHEFLHAKDAEDGTHFAERGGLR